MRAVAIVWLLSTLLVGFGVAAGAALRSPPAAVADLDACALPCWRGIVPRETDMRQAEASLHGAGFTLEDVVEHFNFVAYRPPDATQCALRLGYSGGKVATIALTQCGVRLGDVMRLLGAPDGRVGWNTLAFRGAQVFVTVEAHLCHESVSPLSPVTSIFLASRQRVGRGLMLQQFAPEQTIVYPWRGFVSRGHHFLQAPELAVCR